MSKISAQVERIERISNRMWAVTIGVMLLIPVAFVATLLLDGIDHLLPVPRGIAIELSGQGVGGLAAVACLAALKPAAFLLAMWLLKGLFGLYRQGMIFDGRSIDKLRQLGWSLIGIDLMDVVQRFAVGPLLSHLGASEPFLTIGIGLSLSIIGLFVIVIAKVMALGRELQEFEESTI